ncbi:BBP7 family outer membrane beta-barrel protein [Novipirellula rosea]|uniref:BBP7 family outer membrane beta-barrel protein n=1 Tax=Novipirellula rosea TaxID=1031540 RepID=A0ABP8NRR9_9BACT
MTPRLLISAFFTFVSLVVSVIGTVEAQGVYSAGPNVIVNNSGSFDPYSAQTSAGGGNLFSGGNMFSFPSIGGFVPNMEQRIADRLWIRGEYLYWEASGMDTPPLVTTSPDGTPQNRAGILGESGTAVLFGGGELNDGGHSGFRGKAGFWITPQGSFAIEGEYFGLFDDGDGFSAAGDGSPILARPFFDTTNDRETAQLVSYPGVVNGALNISSDTDLQSAMINVRAALMPTFAGCNNGGGLDRVDWIIGYRNLQLDDRLSFSESLSSQVVGVPGTIELSEQFSTENRFNGLQLGVIHQATFDRAWLESTMRVAVGTNTQRVNISGTTSITENGVTERYPGGLLTQTSNIGSYRDKEFTMIPELGLTLGVRITSWFHATVGYSLLYFPNVVRAGDQIDRNVNPNLIPEPNNPVTGSLRPQFSFVETDYWAQGINFGGQLQF